MVDWVNTLEILFVVFVFGMIFFSKMKHDLLKGEVDDLMRDVRRNESDNWKRYCELQKDHLSLLEHMGLEQETQPEKIVFKKNK